MKILIVSFYYSPELGAAPSRITNMAEGLKSQGAEVDVLTCLPNYPQGQIFEGYRGRLSKKEKINELYPDEKRPGLIFSQLYNFHCVMNNGDLVLIPSEGTKFIRVGVLGETVEEVSKDLIMKAHLRYKPVCANVDFYSGFVYTMLGIPRELFTPIFAIARISGWSAHRLEELVNKGKIIRPAYKYVGSHVDFREIDERE